MILHVKKARYLHDYVFWVRFNDGAEGEVDLADELEGEVFEPLRKTSLFRALRVDPVLQTVVWPNDADVAPEFLYEKMKPSPCPEDAVAVAGNLVRESLASYGRKTPRPSKPATARTRPSSAGRCPTARGKKRIRRHGEHR